jgi:hypothetical protein
MHNDRAALIRAYVSEHGLQGFCQTTGEAVLMQAVSYDGIGIWYACPCCVAGAKFGDFRPQAHIALCQEPRDER